MDLSDGRGSDRLSEAHENAAERFAEGRLDGSNRDRARKRLHPVLQPLELLDNRDADDIRPRREELAELDIGRPEPADRAGKIGKTARFFASTFGPGCSHSGPCKESRQGERQPRGRGQNRWVDVAEHARTREHKSRAR